MNEFKSDYKAEHVCRTNYSGKLGLRSNFNLKVHWIFFIFSFHLYLLFNDFNIWRTNYLKFTHVLKSFIKIVCCIIVCLHHMSIQYYTLYMYKSIPQFVSYRLLNLYMCVIPFSFLTATYKTNNKVSNL